LGFESAEMRRIFFQNRKRLSRIDDKSFPRKKNWQKDVPKEEREREKKTL